MSTQKYKLLLNDFTGGIRNDKYLWPKWSFYDSLNVDTKSNSKYISLWNLNSGGSVYNNNINHIGSDVLIDVAWNVSKYNSITGTYWVSSQYNIWALWIHNANSLRWSFMGHDRVIVAKNGALSSFNKINIDSWTTISSSDVWLYSMSNSYDSAIQHFYPMLLSNGNLYVGGVWWVWLLDQPTALAWSTSTTALPKILNLPSDERAKAIHKIGDNIFIFTEKKQYIRDWISNFPNQIIDWSWHIIQNASCDGVDMYVISKSWHEVFLTKVSWIGRQMLYRYPVSWSRLNFTNNTWVVMCHYNTQLYISTLWWQIFNYGTQYLWSRPALNKNVPYTQPINAMYIQGTVLYYSTWVTMNQIELWDTTYQWIYGYIEDIITGQSVENWKSLQSIEIGYKFNDPKNWILVCWQYDDSNSNRTIMGRNPTNGVPAVWTTVTNNGTTRLVKYAKYENNPSRMERAVMEIEKVSWVNNPNPLNPFIWLYNYSFNASGDPVSIPYKVLVDVRDEYKDYKCYWNNKHFNELKLRTYLLKTATTTKLWPYLNKIWLSIIEND